MKYLYYLLSLTLAITFSCKSDQTETTTQSNTPEKKEVGATENSQNAPEQQTPPKKVEQTVEVAEKTEPKKQEEIKPQKESKPEKPRKESKVAKEAKESKEEVAAKEEKPFEFPTVKENPGRADFKDRIYGIDTLNAGDVVEHKFYFSNTGEAPLNVLKVDVTCGCTVPSFPIIPIMPGEEGFIGVTYNSVGKKGRVKPKITVITDGNPKEVDLYLDGYVIEEKAEEK